MPQLYPGLAPLAVNTSGAGSAGVLVSSGSSDPHGIWPTPNEMVGGDKRFAGNLNASPESLTSRTNWLGWRCVDWIAGGSYPWTAAVSLANAMAWSGIHTFNAAVGFNAGVTFNGTAATTFNCNVIFAGAQTKVAPGSAFFLPSGSQIEIDAGVTTSISCTWNRFGADLPQGTAAVRGLREATGPSVSGNINGAAQDTLIVPAGFTNTVVYTLTTPSPTVACRFLLVSAGAMGVGGSIQVTANGGSAGNMLDPGSTVAPPPTEFIYSVLTSLWYAK